MGHGNWENGATGNATVKDSSDARDGALWVLWVWASLGGHQGRYVCMCMCVFVCLLTPVYCIFYGLHIQPPASSLPFSASLLLTCPPPHSPNLPSSDGRDMARHHLQRSSLDIMGSLGDLRGSFDLSIQNFKVAKVLVLFLEQDAGCLVDLQNCHNTLVTLPFGLEIMTSLN